MEENALIPILNCSRIHIYPKCTILYVKRYGNYYISNDGWKILKLFDGTKNVEAVYKALKKEYSLDYKEYKMFINKVMKNNIITLINHFEKQEYNIYGDEKINFPQAVSIELTNKCNLKCNYCYGNYDPQKDIFIDFYKIPNLFNELEEIGVTTVELTGGEPMLHPQFEQIFEATLIKFKRINILSNGTLFNNKIFDLARENRDQVFFQISIDGSTEKTNSLIRMVKNSFERTLNTLRNFRDLDIRYRVAYMVTPMNIGEMEGVCELFEREKLKNLLFSQITSLGRACNFSNSCCFTEKNTTEMYSIAENLQEKYPNVFYKFTSSQNDLPKITNNCGAGWQQIAISSTGKIRSCLMLDKSGEFGDYNRDSLFDIFNSKKVELYSNFTKNGMENCCKTCSYKNYCANCLLRVYAANKIRIKDKLGLCEVAIRNNMTELLDFNSNFTFKI